MSLKLEKGAKFHREAVQETFSRLERRTSTKFPNWRVPQSSNVTSFLYVCVCVSESTERQSLNEGGRRKREPMKYNEQHT